MVLQCIQYLAVTKNNPTTFVKDIGDNKTDGSLTDYLYEALLFDTKQEAEITVQNINIDEQVKIIPISSTYEF